MSDLLSSIDGLIIDIDGVITRGNEVIPGALEALQTLHARAIPHSFMTNSTIYCRYTLAERMQQMGIPVILTSCSMQPMSPPDSARKRPTPTIRC